jgi:branched-chain amino acid transport system substrate-binding protein
MVGALAAGCSDPGVDLTPPTSLAATTTTVAIRPTDGVLDLGAYLPRTGPGAQLGQPMIEAIGAAVATINATGGVLGHAVTLTIADESVSTGLDELLVDGVDAIIGPASSTVALTELGKIVQPASGVVACSPTATARALDGYPDNKLFFRTVPSDTLLMTALAARVARTGVETVAVGYLDDPYGRGLAAAFADASEQRTAFDIIAGVPFGADRDDLASFADELLAGDPGVVVVLGDADDGARLLAALDVASTARSTLPLIMVNDAIRTARNAIQALSPAFRASITGVSAVSSSVVEGGPAGAFSANAIDCVNLIALAAVQAGSDAPKDIQANMAAVSAEGRVCLTFADCSAKLAQGLRIDYNGLSGSVELSATTGDLVRAWFEVFGFDDEGVDQPVEGVADFEVF